MPMGFKWSVYVAHTFATSCLQQAFELFKSSRIAPQGLNRLAILRSEDAPFQITQKTPLLLHIIDDIVGMAVNWPHEATKLWHRIGRNVMQLNRLPASESKSCKPDEVETNEVSFMGCLFNLQDMVIQQSPIKIERTTKQVQTMITAKAATRNDWERLIGKLVWPALLNRPLLSSMQAVFRVAQNKHHKEKFIVDQKSKKGLRTLVALLPLARVDTSLPLLNLLIAVDASKTASAVVFTRIPQVLALSLWQQAQSERLSRQPHPLENLEAVHEAVSNYQWNKAFIHEWRTQEHISGLEAAAAVLGLEWAIGSGARNARIIMLTDSAATLGAMRKGRSSAPGMLLRCRRFAALALAQQLLVTMAYVRSANNPADMYTRLGTQLRR